jgi:DNA-directed RNA polymerase subunit RPC12/RpoP
MNCLKCGKNITDSLESGVNDSDYYVCDECNLGFNVITSELDEDGKKAV